MSEVPHVQRELASSPRRRPPQASGRAEARSRGGAADNPSSTKEGPNAIRRKQPYALRRTSCGCHGIPPRDARDDAFRTALESETGPVLLSQIHDVKNRLPPTRRLSNYRNKEGTCQLLSQHPAVDAALWDIVGKHLGQPCHAVWGTRRRRVRAYACVLFRDDAAASAALAGDLAARGFTAIKFGWGRFGPLVWSARRSDSCDGASHRTYPASALLDRGDRCP